ncbi:YigZ family protein [Alkalibacillus haloalkaliphilus]|uniref:YigZ family protein n=1 Tax=Alkalibacillus haloalkaliphilus TaxID=94136 RepID=A0A511W654_9BACI|nr:YigZ family protein [Alkalibacillus haloalkaliphilus]GEN46565.1 YigZ family protein [Alkalibacillus haloalkaliphilus]
MLENYLTVKNEGKHEINIQKSRFIGHIKRTETEEEAQAFIQKIKKEHASATHNCSAYMIGEQNLIQKAQDDGEPSGTAGVPMLEVLKQMDLKDTTVVVTRYFGGIKLGAGGLIRAYSNSTSEAIRQIGAVKRSLMREVIITADYGMLGKLENELRNHKQLIENIDYTERVSFHVLVPVSDVDSFKGWIIDFTSDQVEMRDGEEKYIERDIQI